MAADVYIGIDPGAGGGMAALTSEGHVLGWTKMPETEQDILTWLIQWRGPFQDRTVEALIENVHSSPQMGVVSAFKFGQGLGALTMALVATRIRFERVTPQKWQAAMGCMTKSAKFGQKDKNITKRRAQELFPDQKVTHANADALLIAEHARRR